jgi:uncharacterized membrane protein HdeD (DUF308 family)
VTQCCYHWFGDERRETMSENYDLTLGSRLRDGLVERLAAKKTQIFWTGVAMTAVGVLALLFPAVTTFSVEQMVGWLLLFAGAVTLFGAFSAEGVGPFFGQLLLGLLKLALGVYLLTHPGFGMVALTLMLAAVFMVDGAVQLVLAYDLRPKEGWIWILISGLLSIGAGLLIAGGLPGTSLVVLGILVGINFLSTGIGAIMLSRSLPTPAANK